MKRAIMLGWALSVFALMLVSCASSPEATTTTTRQTTGTTTTPDHTAPSQPIGYRDQRQGTALGAGF
jgi:hypothetical protein